MKYQFNFRQYEEVLCSCIMLGSFIAHVIFVRITRDGHVQEYPCCSVRRIVSEGRHRHGLILSARASTSLYDVVD